MTLNRMTHAAQNRAGPGKCAGGPGEDLPVHAQPSLGRRCRFYPSCSEYFIGAVRKYGAISGSLRGIWRICRCHPFNPGGYDPP